VVHPLTPLSVPGASCSSQLPVGYKTPPDGAVILGDLLGLVGDAVTVWEALLEGGCGYFPVGLKTEPGPAAPLVFSFFSSPTFTFLGAPLGVLWGFDWIPTAWGLFCSSCRALDPIPS